MKTDQSIRWIILFAAISFASVLPCLAAPEVSSTYSPDKTFVVVWFDTDLGLPVGQTRSILLQQLPHGDTPFSLVTFPRYTKAAWSSDSRNCVILDAPDNGNTHTWLFTVKDSDSKPSAVSIEPLKPLYEHFLAHSDGHSLWRPGIEEIKWKDNVTLEFTASDNGGYYKITLKVDALDAPRIEPITDKKELDRVTDL